MLAASFIPDGARVLEIGVGTGTFRDVIEGRCDYLGADLAPLDKRTLPVNLDTDPLPNGTFDYVVLLGVLEYLADPSRAIEKALLAAPNLVFSYCCTLPSHFKNSDRQDRRSWGWINDLNQHNLVAILDHFGCVIHQMATFNTTASFIQSVFEVRASRL